MATFSKPKKEKDMKQSKSNSKLGRALLWIVSIAGGLVIVSAIYLGTMRVRMNSVPSDLDYSTTRVSDNGLFRVSYAASTGPIPVNQMHQWTLHVETADGNIVENATITVDGDMPQHGHGLPTRPQVTEYLGDGDYLVKGMKFQMGGWWVMDFTITANGQTDAVHFNMMLQ
jgi:hypothetical protein